jgi:sialic acid synthase SpsE
MVTAREFPPITPYLVAAIDHNHDGNPALARRLVTLANECGAHAVKFSLRGTTPIPAGSAAAFPSLRPSALASIREAARKHIGFIVAPYDVETVVVARRLNPDAYQIDPPALGDRELLRAVARQRKPVLVVAGMCTDVMISSALRELRKNRVVLMHTVSAAPLEPGRTHLSFIPAFRGRWRRPVGYLGWEAGSTWAVVAAALGAVVIEKPFTLERTLGGLFHSLSLDPQQLRTLAEDLRSLNGALAPVTKRRVLPQELDVLGTTSQSLVARRALRRGARLRASDFTLQAALRGLTPRLWPWLEGRRLIYDLEAGEPVTFGMIE